MQREFRIRSQKFLHEIKGNILTFSIKYMKCRTISVVYFKLHAYDIHDNEILVNNDAVYIGQRWIVGDNFTSFYDTFEIEDSILKYIKTIQVELVMLKVNVNNPLTFSGIQLANGLYQDTYNESSEADVLHTIEFVNNAFVNLYSDYMDDYLQVIRPLKNEMTSRALTRCSCTALAPHLVGEPPLDYPTNVFMEFMNMQEQETNIYNLGYKE